MTPPSSIPQSSIINRQFPQSSICNRQFPQSSIFSRHSAVALLGPVLIVLGRRRIQFPAVFVALGDLVGGFEFLAVLVLNPERLPDVVHAILIGRRVVAARRFVADGVRVLPVGVHVAPRHRRTGLGVFLARVAQLGASRARGGAVLIEIETRRRTRDALLDFAQLLPFAFESRRSPRAARAGRRTGRSFGGKRIGRPLNGPSRGGRLCQLALQPGPACPGPCRRACPGPATFRLRPSTLGLLPFAFCLRGSRDPPATDLSTPSASRPSTGPRLLLPFGHRRGPPVLD